MNWQEMKEIFENEIITTQETYPNIREHIYDRCIGIVSREELEKIQTTHIAVLGTGGIGMPLLEILVRMGAETLSIVDKDIIDPTNMNRVQFAFPFTYNVKKVELAEVFMQLINPNVTIRKFESLTSQNVAEILEGVDVAVLSMDGLYSSLVASRYMHDHGIPFVEGWALAGIANARIYTPDGPSYEQVYNLQIDKDYDTLTADDWAQLNETFFLALSKFSQATTTHYTSEGLRMMLDGKPRRSISPFVWIESTILASELIFKLILNRNLPQKQAPHIFLYDYLQYHDLMKQGIKKNLRSKIVEIINNGCSVQEKTSAIMKLVL